MIIGLTGGFASGKSTAAKLFQKNNFFVIDVDKIGHSILSQEDIKKKIVNFFGKEILDGNDINRNKLGNLVFGDEKKRMILNSILHPAMKEKIKTLVRENANKNIVIDAALLYEMELDKMTDKVLLISVDKNRAIKRGEIRNNFSKEKIQQILMSQKNIDTKKKSADKIIENNGSIRDFELKILEFIKKY